MPGMGYDSFAAEDMMMMDGLVDWPLEALSAAFNSSGRHSETLFAAFCVSDWSVLKSQVQRQRTAGDGELPHRMR